jgi:hypothetical protein
VASAVNNDVARIGSLIAVAVVPTVAALLATHSGASAHHNSAAFQTAMLISAAMCALGGVVSFFTIRSIRPPAVPDADAVPFSCPLTGPPQGALARTADGQPPT